MSWGDKKDKTMQQKSIFFNSKVKGMIWALADVSPRASCISSPIWTKMAEQGNDLLVCQHCLTCDNASKTAA